MSKKLPGNYLLRCFPESTHPHEIAFFVSPRLDPHLRRFWSVSDRVGIVEFQLPTSKQAKPSKVSIIVAYGPHTQLCSESSQTRDNLYDSLQRARIQAKEGKYLTFIIGDFHLNVGCQLSDEEDCLGTHGRGKRNENGQILIEWLLQRHLFLCNTAFQHPSRHCTTWEGRFKPPGVTYNVPVYNTIDFIIIPTKYRSLLYDSHSYAGNGNHQRSQTSCLVCPPIQHV